MRLDTVEIKAILQPILARDINAEVRLFGSRLNDEKKGGDIDLIVLSDILIFSDKIDILVAIKDALGEQKIDLHLKKFNATDPWTLSILAKSERLKLPVP